MKTEQLKKSGAEVEQDTERFVRGRQRPEDVPPGIYRVCVEACEYEVPVYTGGVVSFTFKVLAPECVSGKVHLHLDAERPGAGHLCCVFAVAGVGVNDGLAIACREVVGRHLYVEVLKRRAVHVLQLATTHGVAPPPSVASRFPDRDE